MRVTFVTEFMPSSDEGEITGGVEAYCHFVGHRLEKVHDVTFVARPTEGESFDTARLGSLLQRIWFAFRAVGWAWRSRPDIVVGTNYVAHPAAWLAGRLRRVPVVYWYPDVLVGTWRSGSFGRAGVLFELLEKLVLALRADHYIAISETVRNKLVAQGVAASLISVIPCGYEESEVDIAAATATRHAGRVAVVGRLVTYKRVDVVIDAIAELVQRGRDVSLVVVGQGAELGSLQEQTRRLGLTDRVRFEGHVVRHMDVLGEVASSDVFVTASEIEGFGIVVAEAMGLGVPVVVSDIDVFEEVTDGWKGAFVFRRGDARDLADRIQQLMDDETSRIGLIAAAHEVSARYRWRSIADETDAVLRSVVGRPR